MIQKSQLDGSSIFLTYTDDNFKHITDKICRFLQMTTDKQAEPIVIKDEDITILREQLNAKLSKTVFDTKKEVMLIPERMSEIPSCLEIFKAEQVEVECIPETNKGIPEVIPKDIIPNLK